MGGGKVVKQAAEDGYGGGADDGDEPPAALEDAEGGIFVVAGDEHGHFIAGDGAETDVAEAEIGGDGVDDGPLAVERDAPEVEEDRDLDELDDRGGELPQPV